MRSTIHVLADSGQLTILDQRGRPLLAGCYAAVAFSDGTIRTSQGGIVEDCADTISIRRPGSLLWPGLRWTLTLDADQPAVRLRLELENTTGWTLSVERFDVLIAPYGLAGADVASLEVAQTGWQSWSPATPVVPWADLPSPALPPIFGPMLPPTEAERQLAPWTTVIHEPGGHSMLAGFVTARDQQGLIALQPVVKGHRCTASSYAEGIPVAPGAGLRSETLLLVFDEPDDRALERFARTLAAEMNARPWPHTPSGWCSWYYYFTHVTEADVLQNLDVLARQRSRLPLNLVQLDDGYQAEIGDWLAVNDKFPHGLRYLSDAIHQRGFKSGLWLAPFLVSERSQVYARHPGWILRDRHGEPVPAIWNWDAHNYALDLTHPEVGAWLGKVIETMVRDWGYDYLKLDFLYAGALRGYRYDPQRTGVQAYRHGLEIIRQAAGDRFLLGCGAPFAPSVGLVDGMRIGPDVAPFWRREREVDGVMIGLHRAARSTLAHCWMHPHLWINDPDCLLLRAADSDLTMAEVQTWVSVVAMTGGMVLLSDDVSRLELERLAVAIRTLPPSPNVAQPLDPVIDGLASRLHLVVDRAWEHWSVVALFNWHDETQTLTFDPAEWRSLPEHYHLFDLWSGEHQGPCQGAVGLGSVPPHGVRLLAIHPVLDRPQLVGTTLHLLGGAVEWVGEIWQENELALTFRCPGERSGTLAVYVPEPYEYRPGPDETSVTPQEQLLLVPVHVVEQLTVRLAFGRVDP